MKRNPSIIPLSKDHHEALILAQLIKKDAPEYKALPKSTKEKVVYTLNFYSDNLIQHFFNEEKILYPFVRYRDKEIDELFDEIISEHNQIKILIKKLETSYTPYEVLHDIGILLETHIRKEERVLFQKIQEVFGDEELKMLKGKIIPVKKEFL